MKKEKINSGSAIVAHVLFILLFIPLLFYLLYISISEDIEIEGYLFLTGVIVLILLLLKFILTSGDLYLVGDEFEIKRLFFTKRRSVLDCRRIGRSFFFPIVYYVEFEDNKKIYFLLKASAIYKGIKKLDMDQYIKELRKKLRDRRSRLKNNDSLEGEP